MLHSKIYSAVTIGLNVISIEIEVNIDYFGFPTFNIVGLPDKSVEESKERVRTAIKNSGFIFPNRKITINLAPAEVRKKGSIFDLGIAVGLISTSRQMTTIKENILFLGELALDGRLKKVNGVLPIVLFAKEQGYKQVIIAKENESECSLVSGINCYCFETLKEVTLFLNNKIRPAPIKVKDHSSVLNTTSSYDVDLSEIQGHIIPKRALEISAAGGHNLLMSGPPGSGKSLLSKALSSILPKLTFEECLEITKIYSVAGLLGDKDFINARPFRSFHNSISVGSLIGGGVNSSPGEISLAHKGVLFIDEISEMPRFVLDSLRQPLEDGYVSLSRLHNKCIFPSKFTLVASCNPCPCGYLGDERNKCKCRPYEILSYNKRLSGPILDRIDLFVNVEGLVPENFSTKTQEETSEIVRERVQAARKIQEERFKRLKLSITSNSEIKSKDIDLIFHLTDESFEFLKTAMNKYSFSMRAFHRTLKVSRTIADLEGSSTVEVLHVAEALQYRIRNKERI